MNNRVIKFRAWDIGARRMVEDFSIAYIKGYLQDDFFGEKKPDCINCFLDVLGSSGKFVLVQYTGLKDRHGKEIYEGDIVSEDDHNWEIIYDDCCFTEKRGSVYSPLTEATQKDVEVIGNIWENGDLLDK